MTSDFDQLRQFFTRQGPQIGTLKNALVYLDREEYQHSSTNGTFFAVLFRVHNSTDQAINWNVTWYGTGDASHNNRRSIALNGTNQHCPGGNYYASDNTSHNLSIPPNRTSTVIFVASAAHANGASAAQVLYLTNDSLSLPAGLTFIDDFDVKGNGWDD
jgi:hypothetical protein